MDNYLKEKNKLMFSVEKMIYKLCHEYQIKSKFNVEYEDFVNDCFLALGKLTDIWLKDNLEEKVKCKFSTYVYNQMIDVLQTTLTKNSAIYVNNTNVKLGYKIENLLAEGLSFDEISQKLKISKERAIAINNAIKGASDIQINYGVDDYFNVNQVLKEKKIEYVKEILIKDLGVSAEEVEGFFQYLFKEKNEKSRYAFRKTKKILEEKKCNSKFELSFSTLNEILNGN